MKKTNAANRSSTRAVSQSRLNQKSGSKNAFGGYAKVETRKGEFRMVPTKKR